MNTASTSTGLSTFGRLLWMLLGPLALLMVTFAIVSNPSGWFSGADMAYLAILVIMLLGRWLEFQGGHPQTADGQPATLGHLYRYLVVGAATGLAVWVVANLMGNYWLG